MAERVGMVVPGGDLELAGSIVVERVRQVEDRDRVVGRDGLEPRDRLGPRRGCVGLARRGG